MKRIIIIVVVILMNIPTFANWKKSMIRIREERGRTLSVTIDGRRFDKINRTLTIGDLPAGMHSIKVFSLNSNGHGYRNGILIYQGKIMTKPGKIYYCTVSNNQIDIEENCCIDNYGNWNNNDNWDTWNDDRNCWNNNQQWHNDRDHNDRDDRDYNHTWNNKDDNDNWNNNSNSRPDDRNNNYDDNNWNSYRGIMSTGRFESLIEQLRKTSFESSKVNVAKQALRDNTISVNQLKGIVNEFTFESSKLDFIKSSYSKLADKKNIYIINDVFTFQSSKDELTEFLNTQR